LRTEYAGERTGRGGAQRIQLALEAFRHDDVDRIALCRYRHGLTVSTGCSTRKSNSFPNRARIAHACAQAQLVAEITGKRFFVMAITSFN
jgi:hypothetical protein